MAKADAPDTAQAAVTEDQTNTDEVTQTPGADLPDQPVPEPERKGAADRASVPYTEVRTPGGEVISSQPDNSKAVDSAG